MCYTPGDSAAAPPRTVAETLARRQELGTHCYTLTHATQALAANPSCRLAQNCVWVGRPLQPTLAPLPPTNPVVLLQRKGMCVLSSLPVHGHGCPECLLLCLIHLGSVRVAWGRRAEPGWVSTREGHSDTARQGSVSAQPAGGPAWHTPAWHTLLPPPSYDSLAHAAAAEALARRHAGHGVGAIGVLAECLCVRFVCGMAARAARCRRRHVNPQFSLSYIHDDRGTPSTSAHTHTQRPYPQTQQLTIC